jgi:acyl-CoA synthetase (AMP-forming)/AMP-acid ligase II/pimeloyl-ACP methyl ester carboxylesterase
MKWHCSLAANGGTSGGMSADTDGFAAARLWLGASDSLSDLLLSVAEQHANHGVRYVDSGAAGGSETQSYPALLGAAQRVLGGLRARGLRPGDKVALVLERGQDFVPAFWACVLGGYVPCPIAPLRADPTRWEAQLAHVDELLDHPLLVTTERLREELPARSTASLEALAANDPDPAVHPSQRDDLALLMLTSGSTGNAKAVMLTHGNLLAAVAAKAERLRLTTADTTMNWISFDHIAAIEGHLLPLSLGAVQLLVRPSVVLRDPIEFLRLVDAHRVTWTFAPNFLLGQITKALARQDEDFSIDLSALRHLVSGGEAVVVATGRSFVGELARFGLASDAIRPAFGMTETCAGSVFSSEFPDVDAGCEFASLGVPVSNFEMRCAEDGRGVVDGNEGDLQVRGPMVTTGYFNNPEATNAAFTPDGWFRTGDRARIVDGRLTLVGRSKDSIIVNGVNYFSHDLETVLNGLEGVRAATAAAFPTRPPGSDTERLAVMFSTEVPDDDEAGLYRLIVAARNAVILHWGFRPSVVLPVSEPEIPKTSLGKIQRSLLRTRLEAGAFADRQRWVQRLVAAQLGGFSPPSGSTEIAVADVYGEIFEVEPDAVSANADFFELGGTSLDVMSLKAAVEEELGVADLPISWILNEPTVRGLAGLIDSGGPSANGGYDPVVPLQRTGEQTPLFCVHPGFGEVLVYLHLAKYFVHERPFYALRARGFNPGESPFASLEEMVACYVDAIRLRQPAGPYAIAGHSYGGTVAFEVAKALEAAGERVDFVAVISQAPHIRDRMGKAGFIDRAIHLAQSVGLIDDSQAEAIPGLVRGRSIEEQIEYLVEVSSKARLVELDLDKPSWPDGQRSRTRWSSSYASMSQAGTCGRCA